MKLKRRMPLFYLLFLFFLPFNQHDSLFYQRATWVTILCCGITLLRIHLPSILMVSMRSYIRIRAARRLGKPSVMITALKMAFFSEVATLPPAPVSIPQKFFLLILLQQVCIFLPGDLFRMVVSSVGVLLLVLDYYQLWDMVDGKVSSASSRILSICLKERPTTSSARDSAHP